ncbi:hypothetical protein V8B97DRAFT_1914497 [Scleroderma yunnanense]
MQTVILPPCYDFPDPPVASSSADVPYALDDGMFTQDNFAVQPHREDLPSLGPNIHSPQALLDAVNYYTQYNALPGAGACLLNRFHVHTLPPDPEGCMMQCLLERMFEDVQEQQWEIVEDTLEGTTTIDMDDPRMDTDAEIDTPDGVADQIPPTDLHGVQLEDQPDLFHFVQDSPSAAKAKDAPVYITIIHMLAAWLHLQWHLPYLACNALLTILSAVLLFLSPNLALPFITLPSALKSLSLDFPIYEFVCCPSCHDVYPLAESPDVQVMCTTCSMALFLPNKTKCNNECLKKIPCVKYLYLPLSTQLESLLTVPGVEATLDDWCMKPRTPGKYADIFDGEMCHCQLKAPNGTLFSLTHPMKGKVQIVNYGLE